MNPATSTAALEQLPVGVVLSEDETGTVTWVNDSACDLLSAGREELLGVSVDSLLNDGRERASTADTARLRIRTSTGERRWIETRRTVIATPEGAALTLHTLIDISEFESRAKGRSAVMVGLDVSQLDAECGILTRRALLADLGSEVSRSRRYGNPLSAILVRFSDCGRVHEGVVEIGDSRRRVAQTINELLRWVDIVGVLEDGEFLIVLPETAAEPARQVQAKLATALGALGETEPSIASVIACLGWSEGDTPARMLELLKAEADEASAAGASSA